MDGRQGRTALGPGARRLVLSAALLMAPLVAVSASAWGVNGSLIFLGMLPSLNAAMVGAPFALAASAVTPACMIFFLLLRDHPLAGTAAMVALGAAIGLSASRRWHVVVAFVGAQAALALLGAPEVALPSGTRAADASATAVIVLAAWVAFGGLWATLIARSPIAALRLTGPPLVPRSAAQLYALALALLAGAGTFIAMQWLDTPYAWWLLLTIFLVVQPSYEASIGKLTQRVAGTVAGAALAAVAATAVESSLALMLAAIVLSGLALWAYMKRPYWMYTLFLTPAVVLQTSGGVGRIFEADLNRVAFTVAGGAACAGVLTAGRWLIGRAPKEAASPGAHDRG